MMALARSVGAAVAAAGASPLIAVTGPLVALFVLLELRRRRRWRSELAEADALPLVVDHLLQRLLAGSSLGQACRSLGGRPVVGRPWVGPPGQRRPGLLATSIAGLPLGPFTSALDRGATLVEASRALAATPDPSLRLLATTVRLLAGTGGPAVPALRRLRHTLVGRAHRQHRAKAQAATALSSAGLLVLAPAVFALILAGAEPQLATFYLHEPAGAACASASVVLSALGWWWIHHRLARFRLADR